MTKDVSGSENGGDEAEAEPGGKDVNSRVCRDETSVSRVAVVIFWCSFETDAV